MTIILIHISGGDGPKLIDLLQMREKHLLQDRIELLGPVRHNDVRSVSICLKVLMMFIMTFPCYRF